MFNKELPIAAQISAMKNLFPDFRCRWRQGIVVWTGEIQPTSLSIAYLIKVIYKFKGTPDCYVLKPSLRDRSGIELVPHTYGNNRLCLYFPNNNEWTPYKAIAKTIIPWASLWLFYYEMWHATGEWMGGGKHPENSQRKRKKIISEIKQLT